MHSSDMRMDPAAAKAVLEQFVALGYVEQTNDQRSAVATSVRELNYNHALALLDGGKPEEAVALLHALAAEWPEIPRFRENLARGYLALGRLTEAKVMLLELAPDSPSGNIEPRDARRDWMMGIILNHEGDSGGALECLLRAEKAEPRLPNLHILLGKTYLQMTRFDEAHRAFLRALEIDGDNAEAHLGLARVYHRQRRNEDAAENALIAVGLQHFLPFGHFILGLSLARLGHFERAETALETALSMHPGWLNAHRCLAAIYARPEGDKAKAGHHRDIVMQMSRAQQARDTVA